MSRVKLTKDDLASYTTKDGITIEKAIPLPERRRGADFTTSPYYDAVLRMEKGDSFSYPKDKDGHIQGITQKLKKDDNSLAFAFRKAGESHKRIWRTN